MRGMSPKMGVLRGEKGLISAHDLYSNSKDALQSLLSSLRHLNLTGLVEREGPVRGVHGGYCDMFYGYMQAAPSEVERRKKVAIKRLRVHILLERDFAKVRT